MGNTFRFRAGGVYAVEGVFGNGRAPAVRGEVARRRSDDRCLPRVRHRDVVTEVIARTEDGDKQFTREPGETKDTLCKRAERAMGWA